MTRHDKVRVTFLTEQHVGLKTYSDNLRRFVDQDPRIVATWVPITYEDPSGFWERLRFLPGGIRGALRGRAQVRSAVRGTAPDACLFMTQTPVALGGPLARSRPYLVMVDDTPILYDRMSEHYDESPDRFGPLRGIKHRINVTGLRGAAHVVPMSKWARSSLVDDYGVEASKVEVIPTGIDLEFWKPGSPTTDGPLRILFVGGDFGRKGGPLLLDAFRRLPAGSAELHIVTRTRVAAENGVHLYHDMEPNMPELVELFQTCHVFVLPSLAEAFPNVVVEACASGLPAIVTDVGGMAEMIVDGESGFVISPNDGARLEQLLRRFAEDPAERVTMGAAARTWAETMFDGRTNASRVVDLLLKIAKPRA